ncbi:hypothetical protein llg_08440 [Luteolibacter sp. LG18]|nr:hypothetical protein llg_08440 [Luteolibacter sp. LG18]
MLSRWANSVLRFKNGEAAPTRFKIPEQILSGPYDSERIAAGPDGLLIDGGGKLWNRNPEKPKIAPKALADLPKNLTISGITRSAEAPYPGWIVLSGWYSPAANDPGTPQPINPGPLFALRPDDSSFQEISLRYKEALTATPVFAGGRMFYGWAGDLHEGTIKTNLSISGRAGDLEGFRVAPLAMIAATTRNGGHMDVREIAIAGGRIWAALGKQPAALASVPLPANPVRSDLASSLKTQQESLAGATILPLTSLVTAEDGPDTVDHLCGWTGKNGEWKIAFSLEGKTFWLLENGQEKPRQIGVELSIRGK